MQRTFPPMHMYLPLSIARQDIELHKQNTNDAIRNYTEAMTQSVATYKFETEQIVALHVQETSALVAMTLDINVNLKKIIDQLHRENEENLKKIAQLETELAHEQMRGFRSYMTQGQKNTFNEDNLDIWNEETSPQANTLSLESINDFMQFSMFDMDPLNTNP